MLFFFRLTTPVGAAAATATEKAAAILRDTCTLACEWSADMHGFLGQHHQLHPATLQHFHCSPPTRSPASRQEPPALHLEFMQYKAS